MGDSMGGMLWNVLNRLLRQAQHEDLMGIVTQTADFIDGLRAEVGILEVTEYLASVPGPGVIDRTDTPGEVDTSQVPVAQLPPADDAGSEDEEGMAATTDTGDRHQTTVAGDDDGDREEAGASISEDGAG